jgi:hypothetical protein
MERAWCHGCWRPALYGDARARAHEEARDLGHPEQGHGSWWSYRDGLYLSCDGRRPTFEESSGEAIGLAALAREQARRSTTP